MRGLLIAFIMALCFTSAAMAQGSGDPPTPTPLPGWQGTLVPTPTPSILPGWEKPSWVSPSCGWGEGVPPSWWYAMCYQFCMLTPTPNNVVPTLVVPTLVVPAPGVTPTPIVTPTATPTPTPTPAPGFYMALDGFCDNAITAGQWYTYTLGSYNNKTMWFCSDAPTPSQGTIWIEYYTDYWAKTTSEFWRGANGAYISASANPYASLPEASLEYQIGRTIFTPLCIGEVQAGNTYNCWLGKIEYPGYEHPASITIQEGGYIIGSASGIRKNGSGGEYNPFFGFELRDALYANEGGYLKWRIQYYPFTIPTPTVPATTPTPTPAATIPSTCLEGWEDNTPVIEPNPWDTVGFREGECYTIVPGGDVGELFTVPGFEVCVFYISLPTAQDFIPFLPGVISVWSIIAMVPASALLYWIMKQWGG